MGFTACTHFLDLAIAALLSDTLVCGVLHLDNQMVADQLYSLILTGHRVSGPIGCLVRGLVTVGRTVKMEVE
jgi:hypothetical protein